MGAASEVFSEVDLDELAADTRLLFSGPLGESVLDRWVQLYVFRANDELRPDVEAMRSFVIDLVTLVKSRQEDDDGEE